MLSFYEHGRQHYAESVPIDESHIAEFMVGDYGDHGGIKAHGEFAINLHRFQHDEMLAPQVCVFGDAVESLMLALGMGLGPVLAAPDIASADDFSRRLLALGIRDTSHKPLPVEA